MKAIATAASLLLLLASTASAHDGENHAPPAKDKPAVAPHVPAGAHAPGDHEHASPHGGLVATVDKETHVEVLFTDKHVSVWFYDSAMKPVALPPDAKATIVVGKEVKKLDLPVAKNPDGSTMDHLGAPFVASADSKISVVIQATVAGKARSARVERAAAATSKTPPPIPVPAPATK